MRVRGRWAVRGVSIIILSGVASRLSSQFPTCAAPPSSRARQSLRGRRPGCSDLGDGVHRKAESIPGGEGRAHGAPRP